MMLFAAKAAEAMIRRLRRVRIHSGCRVTEMRKASVMIKKEDYIGALAMLETEISRNPDNADA